MRNCSRSPKQLIRFSCVGGGRDCGGGREHLVTHVQRLHERQDVRPCVQFVKALRFHREYPGVGNDSVREFSRQDHACCSMGGSVL
ncbi:hypothetical protein HHK36_013023 [Tetracentron sinense]|uniref:Uncharacterized protein n=1 Tax=Tetracentron sinense TaxID=13715 RepID=A0A834ZA42_TETSI|nr:hypothetical protein HHK36_013023 [Tetracentron sinense]